MLQWPVFQRHLLHLDTDFQARLGDNQFDPYFDGPPAEIDSSMLRLDITEALVESFVANNLPCNPILDPVLLRQHIREVADRGLAWDGEGCLLVSASCLHDLRISPEHCSC